MQILSNSEIERLVAEKPFRYLDFAEQNLVLENMTDDEYDRLHVFLKKSKKALKNSPNPNHEIRQNLLLAMRRQHAQHRVASFLPSGWIVNMLNYRLPVWQAAASVAVILGFFLALGNTPLSNVKTEKVYVYVTDTIYKEVSLPSMDTAVNISPSRLNIKPGQHLPNHPPVPGIQPTSDSVLQKIGASDVPDSLTGYYRKVERPESMPDQNMSDIWQLWGSVN